MSFGGIDGTHTYPKGEHEFQTAAEKEAAESEVEAIRQSGVPVKKNQTELEAERNAQLNADQERSKHDIMGDHAILPKQQAREARAEARRARQAEVAARQRELDRRNAEAASQLPETTDAEWGD